MALTTSQDVKEKSSTVQANKERTLYDDDVVLALKATIKNIWERVKDTKSLKQENLARALGTSQSAVSKLLKVDGTHPWTPDYIEKFCNFCEVSLKREIIGKLPDIEGYFSDWRESGVEPSQQFFEECELAIKKYYVSRGLTTRSKQILKMATKLASKLDGGSPSKEEMLEEVELIVLESALEH